MIYKVTKKFSRGPEKQEGPLYKTIAEAKKAIQVHLAADAVHRVHAIYCLYDDLDHMLGEFDQSKLEVVAPTESEDSSQQRGSSKFASPTPFNTAPRPKGLPQSSTHHDDKDKE